MANRKVNLLVEVFVPEDLDLDQVDLAHFLDKFVEIGLNDLKESVDDENIDTGEDEAVVANDTEWGEARYILEANEV